MLDPDAEAAALGLSGFADVSKSGDARPIIDGTIGRKYGFDWAMDQQEPSFEEGALTVNGAEPSDAVPPAGDYPEFRGDVSAAVEQAIAKVGADAELFSITSDLDYMPFLEAGWSEQAPAGFIALTFREAAEQLGQMAREA